MVGARRSPRIERDRELVGKRFCGGLDDSIVSAVSAPPSIEGVERGMIDL
jgi:hypothetical protein